MAWEVRVKTPIEVRRRAREHAFEMRRRKPTAARRHYSASRHKFQMIQETRDDHKKGPSPTGLVYSNRSPLRSGLLMSPRIVQTAGEILSKGQHHHEPSWIE